ncbi:Nrap protein [Schizophyllum amplum]|uniref:U3 small nucleolar RNA-associated protein 22 n=1 Tax=Schizophyllum amplum TaxID=97359 RepID=A0A550D0H2_9AGAR|nr:Nrap protein [Auriculariopsis ampla]
MALNLKRKRTEGKLQRKTRKAAPEEDAASGLSADEHEFEDLEDGAAFEDLEVDGGPDANAGGAISDEDELMAEPEQDAHPRASGGTSKKPPTGVELRQIKDAANLYQSSSFKLQIDALLPNVRPKASRVPPLEKFLFALHASLIKIPSKAPNHPLQAARPLQKQGVAVPYSLPLPSEDTNWKVAFEKPSNITVVGSWGNKVSVKGKDKARFRVDVAVEMPDSLFQEKDYLNGRFFHKRAFYIAMIAAAIKQDKLLNVDVSYHSPNDDPRLTSVVLTHQSDNSDTDFTKLHVDVCVIPVLSPRCPISLRHLSPSHANVRISSSTADHPPTPLYNTTLLTAFAPRPQLLAVHKLKEQSAAFTDALTLLRVWANQRGFGVGTRMCVRGFEAKGSFWAAVLELLVYGEEGAGPGSKKRKPLGRGLSSYQMFRAALDILAKHDFEHEPIFVRASEPRDLNHEEYAQQFGATFVGSASAVNLLADVPLGSLALLRHEARTTLNALSTSDDAFDDVFLKEKRDLGTRFDMVLQVDISSAKHAKSFTGDIIDKGTPSNACLAALSSVLQQALGNRVKAVAILHPSSFSRPLEDALPATPSAIHIGIIHDPEHAFRLVDHGPPADDPDPTHAATFRALWGSKAELRRFKDGRITESVVWDVKTSDERAHVPALITAHILQTHFAIPPAAVRTWQREFDAVLRLPAPVAQAYAAAGVRAGFQGAIEAFDGVVRVLKTLDDVLPLGVLNVSAAAPQLRYTSALAPAPLPTALLPKLPAGATHLAPIEAVLEFERSARWPTDLRAVQKIKLAFCERVADALMGAVPGLVARVVVGDGVARSLVVDQARLEVVTPEGWAFWVRIWHEREALLLDRVAEDQGRLPHVTRGGGAGVSGRERQEALEAKEVHVRRFVHAPAHHRAMLALSHRYGALSGTVRLVKRWLASHMLLSGHVGEEAVELLCASVFVGRGKTRAPEETRSGVPASRERGLAAVVAFLKDWQWEDGLEVPLYESDTPLMSAPRNAKEGVWRISTQADREGWVWTSHGPDRIVAHRIREVARATWNHLQLLETETFTVKPMFTHPLSGYDFLIHLRKAHLPRYLLNVAYPDLQERHKEKSVRPGFDPAELFLADLQRIYGDTVKFFHDPFGGDVIAGVWNPSLNEPRPFRVRAGYSTVPQEKASTSKSKSKDSVVLNTSAVLSEIERLGRGLVESISVQR